jgi:hypothetical protein
VKIAFCFLTRSNLHQPAVWNEFFRGADRAHYGIYSHAKHPSTVSDSLLAASQIREHVATRFAQVSIVVASAKLLEAAYKDDELNTFFILASESTVPIAPFAKVLDELSAIGERSIISFSVPPPDSEWHLRLAGIADPSLFARQWFRHDQWIVLHRRHVGALMAKPCYPMFKNVFAPDEHYFMNVLVHVLGVPLTEIVNRRTTWVNWNDKEVARYLDPQKKFVIETFHPKTYHSLPPADLIEAQTQGCWFFRKVSPACDCSVILSRRAE